jgi:asparagine synthetase B (glutamine-hydrolysing)
MCGICGVFNFDRRREVQRSWLENMDRQIAHRGPDDDGFPASIIDRRKMGFPTPWSAWLSGPKAEWIEGS